MYFSKYLYVNFLTPHNQQVREALLLTSLYWAEAQRLDNMSKVLYGK